MDYVVGLKGADLVVIEDSGAFPVGRNIHLDDIADNRDRGQEQPEDKGEVQRKQLALITVGQAFGFFQTVHGTHFGMIDHDIDRKAVAISGDDSGNDEEQGPEKDKERLKDNQKQHPREHAEAVQKIAEGWLRPADRIHDEEREADADDADRKVEQRVDQAGTGAGRRLGHETHSGFRVAVGGILKHLVHGGGINSGQAKGKEADQSRKQDIDDGSGQHTRLRLANQLLCAEFGSGSVDGHGKYTPVV